MKINQGQQEFLNKFSCERLSAKEENKDLIKRFDNKRASKKVLDLLRYKAWHYDKASDSAYYVIKSPEGNIVLLFSLECGNLFKFSKFIFYIRFLLKKGKALSMSKRDVKTKKKILEDEQKEKNKNIIWVNDKYSAIEFVLFYINDKEKAKIKEQMHGYNIIQTIGSIFFWQNIVKLIQESTKILGCKYIFLFAADHSEDEKLITYYTHSLNFKVSNEFGVVKPKFCVSCKFMYQEIKDLEKNREKFFDNFNLGPDDV